VPDKFLWDGDKRRQHPVVGAIIIDFILLAFEAGLLIVILSFINKWYLSFAKVDNAQIIKKRTITVISIITFITIIGLMYGF